MNASPQIDFYVLQELSPDGRFKLACRIIEKAYRLGHQIYVRTSDPDHTNKLDDLLWTFSQNSFIPHQLSSESDSIDSPVVIGENLLTTEETDVVISVANDPVSNFTAYPRIVDIVGCKDEDKASGRNRFRYYREHGVEPNTLRIAR